MKIESSLFEEFIKQSKYKSYKKICRTVLLGGKKFSLDQMRDYDESEYLPVNIKDCVCAYTSDKDMAIAMFKDFVDFLNEHGYQIDMEFPTIPINSSFERQMYIAKYLQNKNRKISDLPDRLWVSERTLRDDLKRLRGDDPIQVNGKKFCIPDTKRKNGSIAFTSTMHPIFLTENLTQIIVILKGLKAMASDPLYESYATESAAEIWNQLSTYAQNRIRVVFSDILPEDLSWYESLKQDSKEDREESFYTEKMCSRVANEGPGVVLDCIKNGKSFVVEYEEDAGVVCYKDCTMIPQGYHASSIDIKCNAGEKTLEYSRILRSAYTAEELLAD